MNAADEALAHGSCGPRVHTAAHALAWNAGKHAYESRRTDCIETTLPAFTAKRTTNLRRVCVSPLAGNAESNSEGG